MYVRIRSMYVSMCVCVYVCMYDPCYFPEYPHSALPPPPIPPPFTGITTEKDPSCFCSLSFCLLVSLRVQVFIVLRL